MRARCAGRAGDAGLVALEWLLIVATLAGLAALAVVLAQHVADDTAEQISASPARRTAAAVAALQVERRARAATPANPITATWGDWESYFAERCSRLAILYSDAAADVDTAFARPTTARAGDPVSEAALVSATEAEPNGSTPQVRCNVDDQDGPLAADAGGPPPTIEDFRLAAKAIADAAAILRPGDTWTTWKAHFEPLCSDLAATYAHLDINVLSHFNKPADQPDTSAAVTQDLLDAATTEVPANGRPQIKCEADQ